MISVIIPMYNEANVIPQTVMRLNDWFADRSEDFELLLVNDGSTDRTHTVCEFLPCRMISYDPNRGKGYAMRQGASAAKGDILVFLDADLSYGTEIIGEALAAFADFDADIVVGSRRLVAHATEKYPFMRKAASETFRFLVHVISGLPYSDTQCGFKCYKSTAAKEIFPLCEIERFAIDIELLTLAKEKELKVIEIPAVIQTHGQSSVNLYADSVQMLKDALALRKRRKKA